MTRIYNSQILMLTCFIVCSLCASAQEADCGNGLDDDNDGFIDCADTECYGSSPCSDAFTCTNTLYQVITSTLKKLDPLTGTYESIGTASGSYNGAGFNVQDGYIYGIKSASDGVRLWRINNKGKETDLGKISNFAGRTYVGDFDELGNLYTYTSGTNVSLSYIDVNATDIESVTTELTHLSTGNIPGAADITYNPICKKFFGLSGSHQLIELDHIALTVRVLGDYSEYIDAKGGFGAAWSDQNGNSYFSNNSTGKIFRFSFAESGAVEDVSYVATGQPTNSNDGMGCFFSLPPFEIDCTDNKDNDGDGLTDCEDPDCANAGICPAVDIELRSIELAGPSSIIPFHLQLINKSKSDALDFSIKNALPTGFTFLADSIELSTGASYTASSQPIEGESEELKWQGLNIPVGDTIMISFSLLADRYISSERYTFHFQSEGVVLNPFSISHTIDIDEIIYYEPTSYDCEPSFYQVYKKRGEPNVLGKLNPINGTYDQIALIDHQANGLGYDILSGYAYGSDGNKFIRIDQVGNVTFMGLEFSNKVYVGDMNDSGSWYGKVGADIVKVNTETSQIEETYLEQGMPGWDMAYNIDGHFYAVHKQTLYQFNTISNTKKTIGLLSGDEVPDSGHGAQWTGLDGHHYISNNKTGHIYRINLTTNSAQLCMVTEANLQFNDGFACPTELPVVFEYDYGDNRGFPIARQLVYKQDVNQDNVPDYSMVWLGEEITQELLDPSNKSASGDQGDDGIVMGDNYSPGTVNNVTLLLNSNSNNMEAHYGVWIDWDGDGSFDDFYSGTEVINELTEVNLSINVPEDYHGQIFGLRARITSVEIDSAHYQGDIYEPGEIEDYILSGNSSEVCNNGIDDNFDGLIDCDDPTCSSECTFGATSSAGEGGLESNDELIEKVTNNLYQRKKVRDGQRYARRNLSSFVRTNVNSSARVSEDGTIFLEDLIPTDIIENTKTYISSPQHLINITNAIDLFSVDIYEEEKRVAAILSLETNDGVYEHTKYICDRLTGSKIVDLFEYKIDGEHDFIVAKLERPDGNIEYSSSFSIRHNDNDMLELESYWNIEEYSKNESFYNFQVWANNTNSLFKLCNEILQLVLATKSIEAYNIGKIPETFVQYGNIENGELTLHIKNTSGVNHLTVNGNIRRTETMETEHYHDDIKLSGIMHETVSLDIGDAYYIGLSLANSINTTSDAIFLANGSWGHDYNKELESISDYIITSTDHFNPDRYDIQRSVKAAGEVLDYISFYRSFTARFTKKDLEDYNSLIFTASGDATLEIAIVKEGIREWQHQGKTTIKLTGDEREYVLGKSFFTDINGSAKSWDDAYMIAINVIGNKTSKESWNMNIKNMYFGHKEAEYPFIVYTNKNIIGPRKTEHIASTIDGTDRGVLEMEAGSGGDNLTMTIENISLSAIVIDEAELIDESGAFSLLGFEPIEVDGSQKFSFDLRFNPIEITSAIDAKLVLYVDTEVGYIEVPVNIAAQASCIENDHVDTQDISASSDQPELKAKYSITSNAKVNGENIIFCAGEEIMIIEGFEVSIGSSIELIAEDRCSHKE